MNLSKIKSPNTYALITSILVIIAVFTWILPAGNFDREVVNGREIVVNGSFHEVESAPQSIDAVLTAPIKGFVDASLIIGFVLLVGGAFGIFRKTEAVDSAIISISKAYEKYPLLNKFLLPILITFFSLAGAIFGMSEEIIPFILIFIPLALMLGYDTITGVAIPFVGAGVGFAGAFLNPFTLGIAQGIADVPLFSGMEYRLIVWFVCTLVTIIFIKRYAEKIKKNPESSLTYELDKEHKKSFDQSKIDQHDGLDTKHKAVLITFLLGLVILIFGVIKYQWFIEEIAALFFAMGIITGLIGRLKIDEMTKSFIEGAKDLIGTAVIIALARGILIVATDGRIIDTILYYLSSAIDDLHPILSSQLMFVIQSMINFFVPSGSGQAALTIPIMAPLGDLVGVSRQTAILAFQFGDGFSNLIIPTSAVTMGVLSLAKIPWDTWVRWMIPLQIILTIIGLLLLIPPFIFNW